jgi:hypothetical protein
MIDVSQEVLMEGLVRSPRIRKLLRPGIAWGTVEQKSLAAGKSAGMIVHRIPAFYCSTLTFQQTLRRPSSQGF